MSASGREQEFTFSRLYLMRSFILVHSRMFTFRHQNSCYCAMYTGLQSNELHISRVTIEAGRPRAGTYYFDFWDAALNKKLKLN
jgi:hypothetical protein